MKFKYVLLTAFLLISILLTAEGFISVKVTKDNLQNSIEHLQRTHLDDIMTGIEQRVENRIAQFQLTGTGTIIQDALKNSNDQFEKITDKRAYVLEQEQQWPAIEEQLKNNPASKELIIRQESSENIYGFQLFSDAILTNKYGSVAALTTTTPNYNVFQERWWQEAARSGVHIEDVSLDKAKNIQGVSIAIKVYDDNGEFAGVMKFLLNINGLIAIIDNEAKKLTANPHITWLTEDNRVIYSTKPYYFLEPTTQQIPTLQEITITYENDKIITHMQKEQFTRFNGPKWKLILEQDANELFAPVTKLKRQFTALSAAIVIFAIIAGFIVSKTISRPLKKLTETVNDISRGNFKMPMPKKTNIYELDQLTESLNRVLASLKLAVTKVGIKKEEIIHQLSEKENIIEQTQQESKKYLEFFKTSFDNAPNPMELVEYKQEKPALVNVNKAYAKTYGYTQKELIGKNPSTLKSGKQNKEFYRKMWKSILNPRTGTWTGTMINKKKNGQLVSAAISINTIFEGNKAKYFIGNHYNLEPVKNKIYNEQTIKTPKKRSR